MAAAFNDPRMRYLIGDVRDAERTMDALRDVDIVVHAAALKRIEVCESDPREAVQTNIVGTMNVARACIERGVRRAVLLSTDKSAAPETLYGSTKLVAERLWAGANVYAAGTPTRFALTRYGNVGKSTGSVIPIWQAQRAGGVLTLTDPLMSRFLMSIEDAVALVELALTEMRGGETYIPNLGAATMGDLALAVAPACAWRVVGARPGEKMHETLVTAEEAVRCYDFGAYLVIEPTIRSWESLPPLEAQRVPAGFTLASNTARRLTHDELVRLAA